MAKTDAPDRPDSEVLLDLAAVAKGLAASAEEEKATEDAVGKIIGEIAALNDEQRERLLKREDVMQLVNHAMETPLPTRPGSRPGEYTYITVNGQRVPHTKRPWTWSDLKDFPTKTWMNGDRKIDLHWNGLSVSLLPRREYTLPEVFYGVWAEHYRNIDIAGEHAEWLMKKRQGLTDPTVVTEAGARSRATANHDGRLNIHTPGGGMIAVEVVEPRTP